MMPESPFSGPYIKLYRDEIPNDVYFNDRKLTKWVKALVEDHRAKMARRRQRLPVAQWREILARFDHRCAYCGIGGRLQQEHRMPVKLGGRTVPENIVPACFSCNSRKRADHPDDWPLPVLG